MMDSDSSTVVFFGDEDEDEDEDEDAAAAAAATDDDDDDDAADAAVSCRWIRTVIESTSFKNLAPVVLQGVNLVRQCPSVAILL